MLTVVAIKTRFSQVHSRTRRKQTSFRQYPASKCFPQWHASAGVVRICWDVRACVCVCVFGYISIPVFKLQGWTKEKRGGEKERGIKRRRERTERRRANKRLKVLNRDITDGVYMPLIQPFISSQAAAVWLRRDERFTDLFHFLFPSPQFSVFLLWRSGSVIRVTLDRRYGSLRSLHTQ